MYDVNGLPSMVISTRRLAWSGVTATPFDAANALAAQSNPAAKHVNAAIPQTIRGSRGLAIADCLIVLVPLVPCSQVSGFYAYTFPPAITCCVFSSKVTFMPVWMAATFIHKAMEWLQPASIGAFGVLRERTHSIQLRM